MDIVIDRISKSYGGKLVLDGFSAVIPEGKTTAVLAPSGAGKTTLLRILTGLEKPDSGSVQGLEGKKISMVFQEDRLLLHASAVGNILLTAPQLPAAECRELLTEMGIAERDQEKEPVLNFSGGMKRRVAIARALAADGNLLLLDEPFRGLDPETKEKVMECCLRRSSGKTVILVTHDESETAAMRADRIIRL